MKSTEQAPLAGLIAVVSGADQPIGAAVTARFTGLGATVIGGMSAGASANGQGAELLSSDALLNRVREGEIDILVNADTTSVIKPFESLTQEEFERVYEINVLSALRLCQAAVPKMKSKGWGRIVNVGSSLALSVVEGHIATAASRSALDILTSCIAHECVTSGILVNCIAPNFIEGNSEFSADTTPPELLPIKRYGKPDEVASLVVWLAGRENTYVTGQHIAIDGGFSRFC